MDHSILIYLDEIKFIFKKSFNSVFLLGIIIILYNVIFAQFDFKIIYNDIDYEFLVRLLGILIIIILWIVNKYTYIFSLGVKKRKRFSIIFRFNPVDIHKYNIMRDEFLSKLRYELHENNIDVIYLNSSKKNSNNELDIIYARSNSCIVFDVSEKSGKENNILAYELKIDDKHFKVPLMNEHMKECFMKDIDRSISQYYKITDNNSFREIDKSEKNLENGILYLAAIVYIVSGKLEICYNVLKELDSYYCSTNSLSDEDFNHIKNDVQIRYVELYISCIGMYFNKSPDRFVVDNIDHIIDDLFLRIKNLKNKIQKRYYDCILHDYYQAKALREFELHGVVGARRVVDEWFKLKDPISYEHLLDNAFLLAHEGKYLESIRAYKRIFKTHNISSSSITNVLGFCSDNKSGNNDYPNIFCECIINILAADVDVAMNDLQLLKSKPELYDLIYKELGYKIK